MDDNIHPDAVRFFEGALTGNPFANLSLGEILEVSTNKEGDYYGFAKIKKFPEGIVVNDVALPWSMAGQADFMGGIPLEHSFVILGTWSDRRVPIVISYIPARLDMLYRDRGSVTDENGVSRANLEKLFPGEKLIQAAKKVVNTAKKLLFVPLGRIKLNKSGQVTLTSQNQITTVTLGDALNGGTPVTNSITGKNVVMRIDCKKANETAGITIDIDNEGSYIAENANGDYAIIKKDEIEFDSSVIKIGKDATEAMILGNLFQNYFNFSHIHYDSLSGVTGKVVVPMSNSLLATKGKVK